MPDERIEGKPRAVVAPGRLNMSDYQRLERVWPATGAVVGVDVSLSIRGAVGWAPPRPWSVIASGKPYRRPKARSRLRIWTAPTSSRPPSLTDRAIITGGPSRSGLSSP
jgi:hypothetical protein